MSTEITQTTGQAGELQESTRGVPVYRPLADIRDTGKDVVLTLEMPGVGREDVEIGLERRVLTIRGRGRVTSEGDYERVFTLSEDIDEGAISAEMANGVLTLTLQRAEAAKPKRIEVKAG